MAKRNYNGSFNGYRNQRNQSNAFRYEGPYPRNEIINARETFSYQFFNKSGPAIRSLRQKMYNSINFFHQQQIDSVVSSSFRTVQEKDLTINKNLQNLEENALTSDTIVDIHAVDGGERENLEINITSSKKSVTISSTKINDITKSSSNEEPPTKVQRLSDEMLTSETIPLVDANANMADTLSRVTTDNLGDDVTENSNDVPDNADFIIVSSEGEEGEVIQEESEETDLCLMCDLCLLVVRGCTEDSKQEMMAHFSTARHNAASLIEAKIDGDKMIPRYVKEKLCMSSHLPDYNIVPVCPECNEIHGSVWTCALHYEQCHNVNEGNVYGLGKVVNRGVCQVSSTHRCSKCYQVFKSASKLHKHFKSLKHYPFQEPSSTQIMQFICDDCGRREQSFINCRGHILASHAKRKNITNMTFLYLEKTQKLTLLPQKSKMYDQQLEENKKLLQQSINLAYFNKRQAKHQRRSLLPSKKDLIEYRQGNDYDIDKERYERLLINHLNYNRYHYKQK